MTTPLTNGAPLGDGLTPLEPIESPPKNAELPILIDCVATIRPVINTHVFHQQKTSNQ